VGSAGASLPVIAGATVFALLCVFAIDALRSTGLVKADAAIGLVFPALFSLGVLGVQRYAANVHIDLDATIYGEIPVSRCSKGSSPGSSRRAAAHRPPLEPRGRHDRDRLAGGRRGLRRRPAGAARPASARPERRARSPRILGWSFRRRRVTLVAMSEHRHPGELAFALSGVPHTLANRSGSSAPPEVTRVGPPIGG
jgi:hypothetical protein